MFNIKMSNKIIMKKSTFNFLTKKRNNNILRIIEDKLKILKINRRIHFKINIANYKKMMMNIKIIRKIKERLKILEAQEINKKIMIIKICLIVKKI